MTVGGDRGGWGGPVAVFVAAAAAGLGGSTALAARAAGPREVVLEATTPSPAPAVARELPPGEGRSLVERRCGVCHALGLVYQQRLSPEAWKGEVKKMRGWGAYLDDAEAAAVTGVLASSLGDAGPRYVPAVIDPAEAEAATRREPGTGPPGDAARGAEAYKTSCASCHGDDAQGARGPALRGRPVSSQPVRFGASVRAGRGDMPGYPSFDDAALADLFAFVAR